MLFEPVSVPLLDDDSQRLLDESYSSIYSRGVNPGRLTPQDCMYHCKKVYNYNLCNLMYLSLYLFVSDCIYKYDSR